MDELLEQRYRTLFRIYGAGGSDLLVRAKGRIYYELETARSLRADAALFLLVNVDQMLIRPYAGYVPAADSQPIELPEKFRDPALVGGLVDEALSMIFETLRGERPYSAHTVARAVEASWERLALAFLWG